MSSPAPARSAPRNFTHVKTWVFDLDNTLYPRHLNLWQQVDDRIRAYIADFLKITPDEAFRVQKDCAAQGLTATGFAVIDMAGKQGATVRFRE